MLLTHSNPGSKIYYGSCIGRLDSFLEHLFALRHRDLLSVNSRTHMSDYAFRIFVELLYSWVHLVASESWL
jgi:hypothetical protein